MNTTAQKLNPSQIGDKIVKACELARFAPSAHNSQPWSVRVNGDTVDILLAKDRALGIGDQTSRQTFLSIGCFIESLIMAAKAKGLKCKSKTHASEYLAGHPVAKLVFTTAKPESALLKSLQERRSNRHPYEEKKISQSSLNKIANSYKSSNIHIKVSSEPALIDQIADYTATGIRMALSNTDFREELSKFILPNTSHKHVGMPGYTLGLNTIRSLYEPYIMKAGLNVDNQSEHERQVWQASSALILVFSRGDTLKFWLEAGQAYQRAGLVADSLGLAQATSAAAVEAADFHLDVEKYFRTKFRLQTVMRIGYAKVDVKHSPRLDVEEFIVS